MKCFTDQSESALVLEGRLPFLQRPVVVFVRLAEAGDLPEIVEVPVDVRFICVLMGPEKDKYDYYEIGRALSTLLATKVPLLHVLHVHLILCHRFNQGHFKRQARDARMLGVWA